VQDHDRLGLLSACPLPSVFHYQLVTSFLPEFQVYCLEFFAASGAVTGRQRRSRFNLSFRGYLQLEVVDSDVKLNELNRNEHVFCHFVSKLSLAISPSSQH